MAYPHISPGDKFRPNAEKENAISRLLDKAQGAAFIQSVFPPEERSVSLAYNSGETAIKAGRAANALHKSSSDKTPEVSLSLPALIVNDSSAGEKAEYWGIALEDIEPGSVGPVQLHGFTVCAPVEGKKQNFIDIAKDGTFFFSGSGAARVLRANEKEKLALVFLDQQCVYRGPLAVRSDGETLSVINGCDMENGSAGNVFVNGTFYAVPKAAGIQPRNGFLCVSCTGTKNDVRFEFGSPEFPETDGKRALYPLAEVKQGSDGKWGFVQLSKWHIPELWTFEECNK